MWVYFHRFQFGLSNCFRPLLTILRAPVYAHAASAVIIDLAKVFHKFYLKQSNFRQKYIILAPFCLFYIVYKGHCIN